MKFHKQDEEARVGDEKRAFVPTRASHSHHVAQFLPLTAYVGRVSPWITQFCLRIAAGSQVSNGGIARHLWLKYCIPSRRERIDVDYDADPLVSLPGAVELP